MEVLPVQIDNDDGTGAVPLPLSSSCQFKYEEKVRRILHKMIQPDFKIRNDVYLNSLLSYLAANDAELGCPLLSSPIYTNWLLEAKESWSTSPIQKPKTDILAFAVQLAALISNNELTFDHLNNHEVYDTLIKLLSPISECAPSLKFAFLKLLNAAVQHSKGLAWIIENCYWRHALDMSLAGQTVYISREGHHFVGKLMDVTSRSYREFCHELIGKIMRPLDDNTFISMQKRAGTLEINDEQMHNTLAPTLNLISSILDNMLKTVVDTRNFCIYLTFKHEYRIEQCIANFMQLAQSQAFNYDLQKVSLMLLMHDGLLNMNEENVLNEQVVSAGAKRLFEMFGASIAKGQIANVLKISYQTGYSWQVIKDKVKTCALNMEKTINHSPDPLTFENQLFIIQLIPIFAASHKLKPPCDNDWENDELRLDFVDKMINMIAAPVWRLLHQYKNYLHNCPKIFEYATLSLQYVVKSTKFYNKQIGIITFQGLIYCLKDIIKVLKENPKLCEVLIVEGSYTTLMLDTVAGHIEEFQLTWRDTIETICVMNIAFDFLSLPAWPAHFVVKALKLVEISISKYMAPNMALLVDRISDSTMAFIGPLLYTKLHDVSWEVRDSALEVLRTISHNANTKFPSFQKVVLDSKLPSLALKMALHDEEGFVRASALKCLQEMMQVQDFCAEIAEKYDLNNKIIEILRCETEGIVRMEAATLMAINYELDRLPSGDFLDGVYDVMSHAATSDLHWEVKKNALHFWQMVINQHLQQQGMIDGSFPNVVFSKEHRKIINLTEEEVRKRLLKVLDQLSAIGCLYVLIAAIQDEDDVAVAQAATEQTKELCKLLNKYKVCDTVKPIKRTPGLGIKKMKFEPVSMQHDKNSRSMDISDDVINGILDTNDRVLIEGASMSNNKSTEGHCNGIIVKQRIVLPTAEFLEFIVTEDLDARLNSKQQWIKQIDDVGSLLDDILKEYNATEDVNSMDCY